MTAGVLPVSNIINVTITTTPQGLTTPNVNSILLLTTDAPINGEVYGVYVSPSQVGSNYGTTGDTALMANNIFSPVPNPLSGGGQLVIAKLNGAVQATHGNFTTANISANAANFAAVTSGNLKVTINGTAVNLSGLNFTGATTLAQIAAVINAALQDATVTASGNTIIFSSKKVGTASTIALATFAGGTDLTGATLLNSATGAATPGVNSSGETLVAAQARIAAQIGVCPILSTMDLDDTAITTNTAAFQALDVLYFEHFATVADILGVITTIQQALQQKTRCLFYSTSMHLAKLYKAAYVGRGCSTDYTGSNTVGTMNLKQLPNVVPDPGITQTIYNSANIAGCDIYTSYAGVPGVYSTAGNDYFDNQYADLALKFALQTAGFNYLQGTNTKVPQTEQGMNGLKSAYTGVMEQFVNNDALGAGTWNSAETFGDPATFNKNVEANGYYIFSSPVATQSVSDRNARIAPLVQIAAKRSGAIQRSNVLVVINN